MGKLDGKTALVTGGGRGIGRAIAYALAREGCNVAVASRTQDEIEHVAHEIENLGVGGLAIPTDVSEPMQVERMVKETLGSFGHIDIFVNNAGIAIFKPIFDLTLEDWDRTMAINLRGAFLCTRKVAEVMVKQRSGTIINICSSASKKTYPDQMAYVVSKHGLLGLSKCLGLELKPYGIRVHAICPGGVDTRLTADARPETDRSNWMQPEDIAHVVLMLLTQSKRATIDEIYIRRYDASPIYQ
jgi:NAD(P)-dependent dehydrogenase (short-subunit alcohol dehydrogenase family)